MRPRVRITVAATAILLIHRHIKKKKLKSKRFWVKKLYTNRLQYGADYLMIWLSMMRNKLLQISREKFEILYGLVKTKIGKKNTNFRKAVTVKETYFYCFKKYLLLRITQTSLNCFNILNVYF